MNVHFSSATDEWATPPDFFERVAAVYGPFDLDVCATAENAKAPKFYTRTQDGLAQDWGRDGQRIWMNPPYGRRIGLWVAKARHTTALDRLIVCLVPARTDTAWWHDHCTHGHITFIRGRLKFGGARHAAPFPSALVVFGQ